VFADRRWGVGLLIASFGIGCASAKEGPWPPQSLGGREPARGALEDPAIDPATGRPYDEVGVCAETSPRVEANATIELNEGDSIGPGSFAPWEGSYRCALSTPDAAWGTLQVDVRMDDTPWLTCEARGGGMVTAFAAVSIRLNDADGTPLHDGPCSALANVSAWPGRTSLQVDCGEVALRVEAGWIQVSPIGMETYGTPIYDAQCERGGS
jgi:hypothetical protein